MCPRYRNPPVAFTRLGRIFSPPLASPSGRIYFGTAEYDDVEEDRKLFNADGESRAR